MTVSNDPDKHTQSERQEVFHFPGAPSVNSFIGAVSVHRYPDRVPDTVVVGDPDFYQEPALSLPRNGLTVLYGHRGSSNVLRASLMEVAEEGALAVVNFKVNVGRWNPNKQRFSDLETSRFLNLPSRSSAEIMDDVNKRWNDWLALEGKPSEHFPRAPSNNMHLLDKLVEVYPYNQVVAVAYDVVTRVGAAKFLTIYDMDAVDLSSVVVGPGVEAEVVFEV